MALNLVAFKQGLNSLMNDLATRETDPQKAREDFCNGLADLVNDFVKSASVKVPGAGLVAPNGAVTGQATGTIS